MYDTIETRFIFTYERSATASYLVLEADVSEKIQSYQVEMIANNSNHSILPLYIGRKDDTLKLYYDVTSKQSLVWALKRKKLRKNEVLAILSGVTKPLLECGNYFLNENNFVIDESYIFVSSDLSRISLTYIPITLNTDFIRYFKGFVIRLITCIADIEETPGDIFLQRILGAVKKESFNIAEFDKLLKEMSCNNLGEDMSDEVNRPSNQKGEKPNAPDFHFSKLKAEVTRLRSGAEGKTVATNKKFIYLILSQTAIVLVMAAVFASGMLRSLNEGNIMPTYGGFLIIVAAVDLLILKNVLARTNEEKNPEDKNENSPAKEFAFRIPGKDASESIIPVSANQNSETVFLGNLKQVSPWLQSVKAGFEEKIFITKPEFIIGRHKDQVDYVCTNNAIGKVHAEIICKDNLYYIKDMNSRNGTFVNGIRIDSNKVCEMKNNDRILLANSEYVFKIPQ